MKDLYLYGINSLHEALEAGQTLEKVFFFKETFGERLRALRDELKEKGIPFSVVPQSKFKGIGKKNHQGVLALISPIQYASLDNLLDELYSKGQDPFFLAADSITDIRNIGAISRSAQAFGCHGIITPTKGSALLNSEAIKASSGALLSIPICRSESLIRSISFLKDSGCRVVAITEKSTEPIWDFDFKGPIVVLVGAEGAGIGKEILAISDHQLSIPMASGVGSLNVSVAAGIACSEVFRTRSG